MKKFFSAAVILSFFFVVFSLSQKASAEPKYVGVSQCKKCHKKEEEGNQFGKWEKEKHSKAYETLASDEAKKQGKKLGVDDPQKSPKCLKCHVTGYGEPETKFEKTFKVEDGVQCESCHGPGSDYKKKEIMKDHDKSAAAGLVKPDEKVCKTCHNKDAPTFKSFDFEKAVKKIEHKNPKKEKK